MPIETSDNFSRLIAFVRTEPTDALAEWRAIYRNSERTHGQKIRETLAIAAAAVLQLRHSLDDQRIFKNNEFWVNPIRGPGSTNYPLLVLRFLLGAKQPHGALYEQARSYAVIVRDYLDRGYTVAQIINELDNSSVHTIQLEIRARKNQGSKRYDPDDETSKSGRSLARGNTERDGTKNDD